VRHHNGRPDVAAIKEAINPHDFYLRELGLDRYGYRSASWAVAGLCPFHDDAKQGSFKINQDTGSFKCFSCGAKGGDIVAFLQQRDDLDFIEALKKISLEWEVRSC